MPNPLKPGGRPVTKERMLAELNGDRTYLGKFCKKCNERERYTKGGACVACQRLHSIEARAALKALHDGFTNPEAIAEIAAVEAAITPRYWWHPESGALFTTEGDDATDHPGYVEEIDAAKYLALSQEACYLSAGQCPTPEACEAKGCAGSPNINHQNESANTTLDPAPEPWD